MFVIVGALAAFRSLNSPTDAANVVGAILTRWHYVALLAPVLLLVVEWRRLRVWMFVLLLTGLLFASVQALVDTRIRAIRMQSPVAISDLPRESPVRRRFGILHGVSSMLLLGQVLVAGLAVAGKE